MKIDDHSTLLQLSAIATEPAAGKTVTKDYQYKETGELVQLVNDAAHLVSTKGEAAFIDFRVPVSRWRKGETYIFVLDMNGNMVVHLDPQLEGKNQLELRDINGKPIVHGLIQAATAVPGKPEGWYHYQWPVPGGLLPRWKSSYVRFVKSPSGNRFIIGSGMYNDRMEKEFVVDLVTNAVGEIERDSEAALRLFHDPKGPFMVKDAYIFVIDMQGVEVVNPAFPTVEGQNLLDYKDTQGKYLDREIISVVQTKGSGWVNYMWPKPGENVSTEKSAYVRRATLNGKTVAVGCGVYLAGAPKEARLTRKMTAPELMALVREAADMLAEQGENAYPEFRKKGSKWFHDDTYLFVSTMDGGRAFNAAYPETEGKNYLELKDVIGRPIGRMLVEAANSYKGEGWVHYMFPEPGNIFPAWKSSFVKKVTFPSGKQYGVGSGIYNMEMDKAFIEDVVNRAAALVAEKGKEAFNILRDKTGPFVFMDTYVFVQSPDGTELVNPLMPGLEGRNLMHLKDLRRKEVIIEEIAAAMTNNSAWLELYWYHPGDNRPALKQVYVKKVQFGTETYIVGSGIYGGQGPASGMKMDEIQKVSWAMLEEDKLTDKLMRQVVYGQKGTVTRLVAQAGAKIARHYHENEEYNYVVSGAIKYSFDDREVMVNAGELMLVPGNVPHALTMPQDTTFVIFFAPRREDWLRGEDQYLRK